MKVFFQVCHRRRHGLPGWALAVETGGELRTITMVNAQETVASTGLDNSHDGSDG